MSTARAPRTSLILSEREKRDLAKLQRVLEKKYGRKPTISQIIRDALAAMLVKETA